MYKTKGGVNFGSWMIFALPLSTVQVIVVWLWLQVHFLGFKSLRHDHFMALYSAIVQFFIQTQPAEPKVRPRA